MSSPLCFVSSSADPSSAVSSPAVFRPISTGSTAIIAPALPASVRVGGQTLDPASLPALGTQPVKPTLPTLSAALIDDTGASASDGLTRVPRIGGTAGAVVGGVAGSSVGGHRDGIVVGVLGAVAGAVVGNAVERMGTREEAVEILVQLKSGERRAIVQAKAGETLNPGDQVVIVTTGGKVRVTKAPAGTAPIAAPAPRT